MELRPALHSAALAHKIDDQAAHDARGISQESFTIRELGVASRHRQIRFVQHRRRTQWYAATAAQLTLREVP